ncbi:MAG: cell division protein FtsZ, partial [Gemmatimonadaceae bacterium]
SPLLDNVSISGATGVLVNITGGEDLTLGEVHQINEIVHEAVGEEAEIIFGAVHEPAMHGEIRVTVIATGFDRAVAGAAVQPVFGSTVQHPVRGAPVIPLHQTRTRPSFGTPGGTGPVRPSPLSIPEIPRRVTPFNPASSSNDGRDQELSDMEIPTFIRRQMD